MESCLQRGATHLERGGQFGRRPPREGFVLRFADVCLSLPPSHLSSHHFHITQHAAPRPPHRSTTQPPFKPRASGSDLLRNFQRSRHVHQRASDPCPVSFCLSLAERSALTFRASRFSRIPPRRRSIFVPTRDSHSAPSSTSPLPFAHQLRLGSHNGHRPRLRRRSHSRRAGLRGVQHAPRDPEGRRRWKVSSSPVLVRRSCRR